MDDAERDQKKNDYETRINNHLDGTPEAKEVAKMKIGLKYDPNKVMKAMNSSQKLNTEILSNHILRNIYGEELRKN